MTVYNSLSEDAKANDEPVRPDKRDQPDHTPEVKSNPPYHIDSSVITAPM